MARTRGRGRRCGTGRGSNRGAESPAKQTEVMKQDMDVNVDLLLAQNPRQPSEPQPGTSKEGEESMNEDTNVQCSEDNDEPGQKKMKTGNNGEELVTSETSKKGKFRRRKGSMQRTLKPSIFSCAWSLDDKQMLLDALQKYGTQDAAQIQACIPHKTLTEVREKLYKLAIQAKRESKTTEQRTLKSSAALEGWLDMCVALSQTVPDYSWTISKVVGMLKTLEEHDEAVTPNMPDYEHLYAYIENLLSPTPTTNMPKISLCEAAIMLDLLDDLAQTLKSMRTGTQRKLMEWKVNTLLPPAKQYVPANYSAAHSWKTMLLAFPQQSSLLNAKQNVKVEQQEEEEEEASTSQAMGPPLSPSAHPSKAEDDEVAAINRNSASANQSTASFEPTNEARGEGSSETGTKEELDVSQSLLQNTSPENDSEDSDKILEVQGVKIKMNPKEPEGSLYSINPFAIPTSYLKPFEKNPEPITRLDNEQLDKILVEQKSRKGSGPMPCGQLKMERDE